MYKFEEIQHRNYRHLVDQLNTLHGSGFDVILILKTIPLDNHVDGVSVSFVLLKNRDKQEIQSKLIEE